MELISSKYNFKSTAPTDKLTGHKAYLQYYHKILSSIKNDVTNILEIGVDQGGSLIMWENYLPNALIVGVDIQPKPSVLIGHDRIQHIQTNAYSDFFIKIINNNKKYDLIIDDGPHSIESQIIAAQHFPSLLKDNGILIIEDIQKFEHVEHILNAVPYPYIPHLIDLRRINNQYDDMLISIYKIN